MMQQIRDVFTGPGAAFLITALASVLLPLLLMVFSRGVNDYDQNYNQQEDQEQQQWNPCSWWQFSCKRQYRNYDENGNYREQSQDEAGVPWWFVWGDEEARRRREEMGLPPRALLFIYIWSLALFSLLVYYGVRMQHEKQSLKPLIVALFFWANLALVSLFYLAGLEGGIEIEGPEIEEDGFYGQFAVMMFITYFLWLLFSVAFGVLFYRQDKRDTVEEPNDYSNMEMSSVEPTKETGATV